MLDNDRFYSYKNAAAIAETQSEATEDEDEYVDIKLGEYIFLIDRSGSMSG